jgi:succinate dehydrogenase/fumarate reductase flavoprotein subunit
MESFLKGLNPLIELFIKSRLLGYNTYFGSSLYSVPTSLSFVVFANHPLLYKELIKNNAIVKTNCVVSQIISEGNKIININTNQGKFYAKSFILATGGMSHPETGSTGDGFKFLEELGHTVTPSTPDIVPISVKENWVKKLSLISSKARRAVGMGYTT